MFNNITLSVFPFFPPSMPFFVFFSLLVFLSCTAICVVFPFLFTVSAASWNNTTPYCAVADQDLVFDPNAWRFLRNSRASRERGKFPAWCVRQNLWLYDSVLCSKPITTHTHTHTHERARLKISRIVFITIHCNTVLLFAVIYSPVVKRRWRRD